MSGKPSFASTNPWRELPDDPQLKQMLKEFIFIDSVLHDLAPTALPGDDFDLYDRCLRSLETRDDLTLYGYYESDIQSAVKYVGRSEGSLALEVPFDLYKRAKQLAKYWEDLVNRPGTPQHWERSCERALIPPFISGDDVQPVKGFDALGATEEQLALNEVKHKLRMQERAKQVTYFTAHPPKPLAYFPIKDEEGGGKEAWKTIYPDGKPELGSQTPTEKLDGNVRWRPMYFTPISSMFVPFDWEDPNEAEETEEQMMEKFELMGITFEDSERHEARGKEQEALIARIRAEKLADGSGTADERQRWAREAAAWEEKERQRNEKGSGNEYEDEEEDAESVLYGEEGFDKHDSDDDDDGEARYVAVGW